jgi:hypothetical protein
MDYFIEQATSVDANNPTSFIIGIDSDQLGIAAVDLRITLDTRFFTSTSAQSSAFLGADEIQSLTIQHGDETTIQFIGTGAAHTLGRLDLVEITTTPLGPMGRGIPVSVENRGAVDANGFEVNIESTTLSLFLNHGAVEIITDDLRAAYIGSAYQLVLRANGGHGDLSWSIIQGSLPSGLSLQPNGILSGSPSIKGVYDLRFHVSSQYPAPEAEIDLQLTVHDALLKIISSELPLAAPNKIFEYTLQSTGGRPPISWSATNLPPSLRVQNNTIIGTIDEDYAVFGVKSITLTAQDTSPQQQVATKTLSLTVLPTLPRAWVSADRATSFTAGRDLYHTQYQFDLSTNIEQLERDRVLDEEMDRAKDEILSELIHNQFEDNIDENNPFNDALGRNSTNVPLPNGAQPPTPNNRDRLWQLLQLYNELDELQNSVALYNANVEVLVDDVVVAIHTSRTANTTTASAELVFSGISKFKSIFIRIAERLMGSRAYASTRKTIDNGLSKTREKAKGTPIIDIKAEKQENDPISEKNSFEFQRQFDKKIAVTNYNKIYARSVAVGAILLSALIGDGALMFVTSAFIAVTVTAGARFLKKAQNNLVSRIEDLIVPIQSLPPIISFPNNDNNNHELTLTPGNHRVSIRWTGHSVGTTKLVGISSREARLNYRLVIHAVNHEHWLRFDKPALEISGSGSLVQAHRDHDVELPGSDIDIVFSRNNHETIKMRTAMGDGNYSDAKDFPGAWPDYRLDPPPITNFLQTVYLDTFGRSSVVAASKGRISVFANLVGGIRNRPVYPEGLEDRKVTGLCCGKANSDGWKNIFAIMGNKVVEISDIQPDLNEHHNILPLKVDIHNGGTDFPASEPIANVTTSSLFPEIALQEDHLSKSSFVLAYKHEAAISYFNTDSKSITRLINYDEHPQLSQPKSIFISNKLSSTNEPELFIALWQKRKLLRWALNGRAPEALADIELPIRPHSLHAGNEGIRGFCVAGDGKVIELKSENVGEITQRVFFAGSRELTLARSDLLTVLTNDSIIIF